MKGLYLRGVSLEPIASAPMFSRICHGEINNDCPEDRADGITLGKPAQVKFTILVHDAILSLHHSLVPLNRLLRPANEPVWCSNPSEADFKCP